MLECIQEHSGLLTLFFTFVVAFSTLVYAILTLMLVNETKKMRRSQTDPEIFVTLLQHEAAIHLVNFKIENIGLGPAYNIRFNVLQDLSLEKKNKISNVGFIKNGIKFFSPKQNIEFFLAHMLKLPI